MSLSVSALLSISLIWSAGSNSPTSEPGQAGVVKTSLSLYARLHDVPIQSVALGDGFWSQRLEANRERSLHAFFEKLEEVGALDKLLGRENQARGSSDADIAKWMEAAAYALQSMEDSRLRGRFESVVADIQISSKAGGYLRTRYYDRLPEKLARFKAGGELYCLGHLIQAAIAHHRTTGESTLLDIFREYVDNIINQIDPQQKTFNVAHPEIEMALIELYRTTGEERYLDFADYLLNGVDLREDSKLSNEVDFEHTFTGEPFKERRELSDHAVCAMYACSGAADYYLETGDEEMWRTLNLLWTDLTRHKMYITGGLGSRPQEEAIGSKYELPNESAYAETCASIGNIMWNWRLLQARGESRFMDVIERVLYNGFLSGVSLEGDTYFYWNPLLSRADITQAELQDSAHKRLIGEKKSKGIGLNIRQPYYSTPCCPPNVQRMLSALPGYMYSTSSEGIWVHLFHDGTLDWRLETGEQVILTQKTRYPWEGNVTILVEPASKTDFSIFIRIPSWSQGARVIVNGRPISDNCSPGKYCEISRVWERGDTIQLDFDMPVQIIRANPLVRENSGRVAIQRGPVVYCLESIDSEEFSIFDIVLPLDPADPSKGFDSEFRPDLLDGIVVITKEALVYRAPLVEQSLYSNLSEFDEDFIPAKVTAIPYYTWANRGISDMEVWIPWIEKKAQDN